MTQAVAMQTTIACETQQEEDVLRILKDGIPSKAYTEGWESAVDAHHGRPWTQEILTDRLYQEYTNSSIGRGKALRIIRDTANVHRFVSLLSSRNASRWSWAPDYSFVREEKDHIIVRNPSGDEMHVHPFAFDGPNALGNGRMLQDSEARSDHPTWFFLFGEDGINTAHDDIVRVYWAISAEGAPQLIAELTHRLNKNRVPFHFKTLRDPVMYGRADSAVLYMPRFVWDRASAVVADIVDAVRPFLQSSVPRFTKPLAEGVGVADDPGGGQSFGMARCGLAAETVFDRIQELGSPEAAAAAVVEAFRDAGHPPGRIHLRPDNPRDYSLTDYTDGRNGGDARAG